MSMDAMITIEIPVGIPAGGYRQTHVDVQLNADEAEALAAIRGGLRDHPQRLSPRVPGEVGRFVNHENGAEVMRYVLQQVAAVLKTAGRVR